MCNQSSTVIKSVAIDQSDCLPICYSTPVTIIKSFVPGCYNSLMLPPVQVSSLLFPPVMTVQSVVPACYDSPVCCSRLLCQFSLLFPPVMTVQSAVPGYNCPVWLYTFTTEFEEYYYSCCTMMKIIIINIMTSILLSLTLLFISLYYYYDY